MFTKDLIKLDLLKAGVSVLAVSAILAMAQPVFGETLGSDVSDTSAVPIEALEPDSIKEKIYDYTVEHEDQESYGPFKNVDETSEESVDEEEHSSAADGWWKGVTDWYRTYQN